MSWNQPGINLPPTGPTAFTIELIPFPGGVAQAAVALSQSAITIAYGGQVVITTAALAANTLHVLRIASITGTLSGLVIINAVVTENAVNLVENTFDVIRTT